MPSRTVEFAILDTSVYIENFRTGRYTQVLADSPFLFRGISVVIHELVRCAKRLEEREFALDLANNLRLYTPTERIWQDSGDIVARLASAQNYEKRKIQELSFDVLIALTARSIGATVIISITTTSKTSSDIDDFGFSRKRLERSEAVERLEHIEHSKCSSGED